MSIHRIRPVLLALASLFVFAQVSPAQESLAEVVRRSRSTVQMAKRVFTNDDIPSAPGAQPAAAEQSGDANLGADKSDADKSDADNTGDADSAVREEIEHIKKAEAAFEQKLQTIKEKLVSEPDELRRRMWADALDNQRITLEQFKRLREQLERSEQQNNKGGVS